MIVVLIFQGMAARLLDNGNMIEPDDNYNQQSVMHVIRESSETQKVACYHSLPQTLKAMKDLSFLLRELMVCQNTFF